MDLYITEKPSLAEAIAAVLPGKAVKQRTHYQMPDGTIIAPCFGHMLEQFMPHQYDERYKVWRPEDIPIVPTEWKLAPVAKTAPQLTAIKGFLKSATRVIHAGDPDAEGQLIVDEILNYYGNRKPVMRVLINDYNTAKVKHALATMRPNTDADLRGWSAWALCRSKLDWLFGLNLTRAYTLAAKATGHEMLLSVGRVQSPTLAIVVNRDNAIDSFKAVPFYTLTATAEAQRVAFSANWKARQGQAGLDADGRLIDGQLAASLQSRLAGKPVRVTEFDATAKERGAPLPYYIDTLQMAANDRFGYSAKKTLDLAQSLYETHKLTTYPRSDCPYLSRAQHAETPARLKAVVAVLPGMAAAVASADVRRVSTAFNDAKVTAHHGIVPTLNERGLVGSALSEDERNIYGLIASNFLAQFYPPEQYEQTTVALDIDGERFTASGKRVTSPGWTAIFQEPSDEAEDEAEDDTKQSLPRMAKGDSLTNLGVRAAAKKTTPPPRFTEKLLLKAMANVHTYVTNPAAKARLKEGQGIGTPATRADVIEELKSPKRGYLTAKGKQLISTPEARAIVAALPSVATDAGFTGLTEQTLDAVAAGKVPAEVFMAKTVELVTTLVKAAAATPLKLPAVPKIPCPVCKEGELKRRKGAKGVFWGCTRYNDGCKASYDDNRGKPQTKPKASTSTGSRKPAKKATKKAAPGRGVKKTATARTQTAKMERG
ncbi:DNA topoisomerase 3 [Xanthomonas campestris pv. campestris]|uniref:DNA topoisomerase 3 n=1 Tax=Xanthomonas campestris TaxID=339 RepID=UPI001E48C219|nr:DNA topoisomerase 3 [Xanthomonas campestris]MCD0253109.1 DNA topoisomerase 3 [Xanthomonas campestris pv. campestris]